MNIGILGYGRMGREIEQTAKKRNHTISAIFDINKPFDQSSDMNATEVLIDFTLQDAVLKNLETAAFFGIPIVEGTTGWLDHFKDAQNIAGLTMIYSPNFSLGVYMFTKLAEYAAQLLGSLGEYDCSLHEWHHRGKADSPSGTAKKLADVLLAHLPEKEKLLFETSHGKIDPAALHVTSSRVGRIPGTHEIGFDSDFDFIQLKHQAHGREGFAYGAVRAAEWIVGKKGIFTMDDFMASLGSSVD